MLELEYTVLDTETTLNCPIGFAGHPAYRGNWAFYLGFKTAKTPVTILRKPTLTDPYPSTFKDLPKLWVGHNIKFDLLYLWKMPGFVHDPEVCVWDTALVEYLLSAQTKLYPTLDYCAEKYGGTIKDDRLKEFFEKGEGADKIPASLIYPYLENDVLNTEKVFLAQLKEVVAKDMLPLVLHMNDALLCTTLMQWNGMKVDMDYVTKHHETLQHEVANLVEVYTKGVNEYLEGVGLGEFKNELNSISSPKQLSTLFFGGIHKYKVSEKVGVFKNGKDKFKLVEKEKKIYGLELPATVGASMGKVGYYTVDETVLKNLKSRGTLSSALASIILDYREKEKQATTYFGRLRSLVIDGYVYPNLNHTSTITGRLSCTEPNLQNQTNGPIKGAFVSRWGENGTLIDIDYNQLEVVGLAYISGCAALKNDLNNGVDMHTALFEDMYHKTPTKEERKPFKSRSFLTIYGGTAKTLAEQCGIPKPEAARFIETFYTRYPGVKLWHEQIVKDAKAGAWVTPDRCVESGMQIKRYTKRSVTGRHYSYRTYARDNFDFKTKKRVTEMSFSPTELKNYPVQGFSTGDVVPIVLGKLYRWWVNLDPVLRSLILPVVTVHDSIVFDVHGSVAAEAVKQITKIMLEVKEHLKEFDINDWDVIMKVGVSVGDNWYSCKEVSVISSEDV